MLPEQSQLLGQKGKHFLLIRQEQPLFIPDKIPLGQSGCLLFAPKIPVDHWSPGCRCILLNFRFAIAEGQLQRQDILLHVKPEAGFHFLRQIFLQQTIRILYGHQTIDHRQNIAAEGGDILWCQLHFRIFPRKHRIYLLPETIAAPQDPVFSKGI